MADYIYLLETRLSKAQRAALEAVREIARSKGLTVFLVGGAVRDLTSGSLVRDLDVVVQGNALKLKKDLEKAGATLSGESDAGQAVFVMFPGGVRMEVGSALSATYPKPGKVVLKPASLLDDLRRRDFTANAMALSLNEGSYGLLMDPLNGVADIENRELRLVSNYGFIEDPVRMIRAVRLMARLGWQMEEKTRARYETGKEEGYISAMGEFHRGYETEEIFHEEEPLRVMRRLEEEGWIGHLFAALSTAKANVAEMERLRETQMQLQMQGIVADAASANFPLLTGKLSAAELGTLKGMFPRQGFVARIDALDAEAKEFAGQMLAKSASLPSQAFRLIHEASPEVVLWAAHTSKSSALQAKFKSFYGDWPQARQKIPYVLMQEMRITPELPQFEELVEKLFFALMDGQLGTVEEMRAFLEPYSPPAPPPPVHLRRARAGKKDAKGGKGRKKAAASVEDDEESGADSDRDEEDRDEDQDRDQDGESREPVMGAVGGDEGEALEDGDVDDAEEDDVVEPVAQQPKPSAAAEPRVEATAAPVSSPSAPAGKKAVAAAPAAAAATDGASTAVVTKESSGGGKAVGAPAKGAPAGKATGSGKAVVSSTKTAAETKSAAAPAKAVAKKTVAAPPKAVAAAKRAGSGTTAAPAKGTAAKAAPVKVAGKSVPAKKAVVAAAAKLPAKKSAVKAVPAKKVAAKKSVPAKKTAAKAVAKKAAPKRGR